MSKYSDLLIYQYYRKPKARATVNAYLDEYDTLSQNALDLLKQLDIDTATGFSLDIIGHRVGVSRTLPSAISKGYFAYFESIGGQPWGAGIWYRKGESTGTSMKLNDEDFRFLIKAKILKNFQDGTFDYILKAMRSILNDSVIIDDLYNMSANILLPLSSLNAMQRYMIERMDILPRPMGVMYNYVNASGKEFGYDGFYNSFGFNEGRFVDA